MKQRITIVTACVIACIGLMIVGCGKQEASAPSAPMPAVEIKRVTTSTGIDMVLVPGGSFIMSGGQMTLRLTGVDIGYFVDPLTGVGLVHRVLPHRWRRPAPPGVS